MAGEPSFGIDGTGIYAGKLGDATHQPVELHRLEKGDESFVIGFVHGKIAERHREFDVVVEGHELFRQARVLGMVDKRLPAFFLFDLRRPREQGFQIAIFADQLRRRLYADAGHARHIVSGVAD